MERKVAQLQTAQIANAQKTSQMNKNYKSLKSSYDNDTNESDRLLTSKLRERNSAQDDHNKSEALAYEEACRNLELKRLLYQVNS